MTMKTLIGILGPATGGKSSLCLGLNKYDKRFGTVSFAEYLKEEATRRGWNGAKDEAGRMFLQATAEALKKEHGESVFYDVGVMKALQSPHDIILFDDTRHFVEILPLHSNGHESFASGVVTLNEEGAEAKWIAAAIDRKGFNDWARHRSETEWRVLRHLFPTFVNDKSLGLSIGVNRFLDFITTVANNLIEVK